MTGASVVANYGSVETAKITHENMKMLDYGGKSCNNDINYKYDRCKQDFIYKVNNFEN